MYRDQFFDGSIFFQARAAAAMSNLLAMKLIPTYGHENVIQTHLWTFSQMCSRRRHLNRAIYHVGTLASQQSFALTLTVQSPDTYSLH